MIRTVQIRRFAELTAKFGFVERIPTSIAEFLTVKKMKTIRSEDVAIRLSIHTFRPGVACLEIVFGPYSAMTMHPIDEWLASANPDVCINFAIRQTCDILANAIFADLKLNPLVEHKNDDRHDHRE